MQKSEIKTLKYVFSKLQRNRNYNKSTITHSRTLKRDKYLIDYFLVR